MTHAKKKFGSMPAGVIRCCLLLALLCLAACATRSEGESDDESQVKVRGQYDVSIGTVR